jgi:citrate lyase beta subunit
MLDDIKLRQATLVVLLDLEDAVAQGDLKAVQEGREKGSFGG